MIYLFICFEVFCFYPVLVFSHAKTQRIAVSLVWATVFNLFLSVVSLLFLGFFMTIHFGLYLFVKTSLFFFFIFVLRSAFKISFKKELQKTNNKIKAQILSPTNLLILFVFICLFINALGSYPDLWDSYSYHLPVAANFLKNGILDSYQYYGLSIGSYYPHAIELLYSLSFSICGITHSSLINLPSILLLFLGIYLFAHDILKVNRPLSVLGALVFLYLPLLSRYFFEAYVDLYFCSFCILALYFLFGLYTSRKKQDLICLLALMSLMAGTKYQGISFSIYMGIFVLIAFLKFKIWKKFNLFSYLWLFLLLLPSSFFYIKNYYITNNPFFPISINIPGILTLPGHYDHSLLINQTALLFNFPRISRDIVYVLIKELSLGLILLSLIWVHLLLSPKKIKKHLSKNLFLKYTLYACLFLLLQFLLTPYSAIDTGGGGNFSLRLGLIFFSLFYLISLSFSNLIPSKHLLYLFLFFLSGLFVSSQFSSLKNMILAAIITLFLFLFAKWNKSFLEFAGFLVITLGLILLFKPTEKKWENIFYDSMGYKNLNVAYAGSNRHFQLYDKHLKFNIHYINVDREQEQKWDKESRLTYHKHTGNFSTWLKNILKKDIDFFVFYSRNTDYIENIWIRDHPEMFIREIQNIFMVNKEKIREYILK